MRRRHYQLVLLIITAGLALSPILNAGYYSDDAFTSKLNAQARMDGTSLLHMISFLNTAAASMGRFFPLYIWLTASFWYFCTSLEAYQLVRIAAVAVSTFALALFITEVTASTRWAILGAAVTLATIQFRIGDDPILSYQFHLPLTATLIFVCAAMFLRYRRTGRRDLLIASAGAYMCGVLLYEIFLITLPLLFVLCLLEHPALPGSRKMMLRGWAVLVTITAVYLGATLWIRQSAYYVYSGIALRPSLASIGAYMNQLSATVPFSQLLFAHNRQSIKLLDMSSAEWFIGGALLVCSFSLATSLGNEVSEHHSSCHKRMLAAGAVLLLLAPLPVAFSKKYQEVLQPGVGYLPVFLQSFGLSLVLVGLLMSAHARIRHSASGPRLVSRTWGPILSLLFGLILLLQWRVNNAVVDSMNGTWRYPRETIETALAAGLLDEASEGATLLRRHPYSFEANLWSERVTTERSLFYFASTGRIYRLLSLDSDVTALDQNHAMTQPAFFVYFNDSYAVAGRLVQPISESGFGDGKRSLMRLDSVRIFRSSTAAAGECRNVMELPRRALRKLPEGTLEVLEAPWDIINIEAPCRL